MNANQVLFQWLCVECICLGGVSMFCTMNRRVSNMFGVFDTSVKDASSVIVYYKMGDSFGEYKNDQHKVVSVENVTGRGEFGIYLLICHRLLEGIREKDRDKNRETDRQTEN